MTVDAGAAALSSFVLFNSGATEQEVISLSLLVQITYEYEYSTGVFVPKRNDINNISPNF